MTAASDYGRSVIVPLLQHRLVTFAQSRAGRRVGGKLTQLISASSTDTVAGDELPASQDRRASIRVRSSRHPETVAGAGTADVHRFRRSVLATMRGAAVGQTLARKSKPGLAGETLPCIIG